MYYADYVILGQVIEALNPSENISSYVCKERETKLVRPRYDPTTDDFLGLYETVSFLVVRGDEEGHFLNYKYDDNKSKLLYSFYKRRITNLFREMMFKRNRIMFDGVESNTNFSKISFSLPSNMDKSEEINQYMNCVNIHLFDTDKKEISDGFNPICLDFAKENKGANK